MDNGLTLARYFDDTNAVYMTGAFTQCWPSWRYDDVTPGYNKLYYLTDGEFYLKINEEDYIVQKGQMFLLPFNSTQSYYHISERCAAKYWLHFTAPCKDHDLLELITLPHFITVEDPEYIVRLFEEILELDLTNSPRPESRMLQKARLMELLAYYIKHSNLTDHTDAFKDEKLADLIVYIEEHLHENLTIEELSSIMHFHPNYFIRYFRKATGQSPMRFICDLRIEHAKRLLLEYERPIQDIATSVGFKTSYYFSRMFKRKTGFTPSDYRLISVSKPIYPD